MSEQKLLQCWLTSLRYDAGCARAETYQTQQFVQKLVGEVDLSDAKTCAAADRCARRYIASVCLAVWIRKRNLAHGVAPSAQDAFHTYQQSSCSATDLQAFHTRMGKALEEAVAFSDEDSCGCERI